MHLLWRAFCDRHVLYAERPARVRKDDDFLLHRRAQSDNASEGTIPPHPIQCLPRETVRDVIVLNLSRASTHTGNWEKLAMAMVHTHDFFLPQVRHPRPRHQTN